MPDLFREGQGVVAEGTMGRRENIYAKSVLAKHDENYMPPECKNNRIVLCFQKLHIYF